MKYIFKIIFISTFLFFSLNITAQTHKLSVKESIQIALEQNLQYRISEKSVEEAEAQKQEAIGEFFPTVNFNLIKNLAEKVIEIEIPPMAPGMPPVKTSIDFTKDYQAGMSVTQPLFTGGAIYNNLGQSVYNLRAVEENYRSQKLVTIFEVKKAYYNILITEQLIIVANEAFKLAENTWKMTKLHYEQGIASKFDLLTTEVAMENIKPKITRSENANQMSILGLKNLLYVDLKDKIILTDSLKYERRTFSVDSLLNIAYKQKPELLQLHYRKEQMGKIVDLSYSSFLPKLFLQADWAWRKNSFNWDPSKWDNNYSVNLVLSIPIFEGTKRIYQVQQAKINYNQIELSELALVAGTELEIKNNYLRLLQSIKNIDSQMKNVGRAEENVRIAELNYAEGLITVIEMSNARINLTDSQTQLLQLLYDYLIAVAALEKSAGIENWN